MRRLLIIAGLSFTFVTLHAGEFVSRNGQTITDSTGKVIQLKGVNLGGWLLWEGWIWGGGFTKESDIRNNLAKIAGENEVKQFQADVYRNFINENDIKAISALGLNVVRIPFNHRLFDSTYSTVNGWQIMDSLLYWCEKYHVYAVLDMHGAPGGQSGLFIADPVRPNLWKSQVWKQQTVNLWMRIASRYRDRKIIAGYDLLNEPIPPKNQDLYELYNEIVKAIRSVDMNHMLIIEGSNFAKEFSFFTKLPDNNMMFSFHIYTWFGGEPKEKLLEYAKLRERLDVPVWCGEWGENGYDVLQKTLEAFALPVNGFSGWCFWTWKKVPNNYAALNAINVTTSWRDVITWCGQPSVKKMPGHDVAIAAMNEFRKAMRYENTNHDYRLGEMLKKDAIR